MWNGNIIIYSIKLNIIISDGLRNGRCCISIGQGSAVGAHQPPVLVSSPDSCNGKSVGDRPAVAAHQTTHHIHTADNAFSSYTAECALVETCQYSGIICCGYICSFNPQITHGPY